MEITDKVLDYEAGEMIASGIEAWLREQDGYTDHDFYVQDLHYFNWDETPSYFAFLVEDGKPKNSRKYIEIIVREMCENYPTEMEFSNHGFPGMSNTVWSIEL